MLDQPTIAKLTAMRLQGMVDALESFERDEEAASLSFGEKLAIMVPTLPTGLGNRTPRDCHIPTGPATSERVSLRSRTRVATLREHPERNHSATI